jgi:type I restriction enzyme S subunit
MRDHVRKNMTGTNPNIQKINQATILSYPFPVEATLTEQVRIVAYLDTLQDKIDELERVQAETATELDAILPAILDRAFRGEL